MIVEERRSKALFRHVTNRNLLWQYDFLIDSIRTGLRRREKLTGYIIGALNFFAVVNLSESPGQVRTTDVHVEGADHQPPGAYDVKEQYLAFIPHLHAVWDHWDALHVAAYVLWKINWIHPFMEGNGRTARAAMYYALSIKMGRVLEGNVPIPALMRRDPPSYYRHLKAADRRFKDTANVNVDDLAAYLGRLLYRQLSS
jgi:hypothetical protein